MRFRGFRYFLALAAMTAATAVILRHFDPAGLYAAPTQGQSNAN
ncbi:MAG TPA: hypothetical protein VIT38_04930 [Allosphingosinicella sp.]